MNTRSRMTHRALVERNTSTGVDGYNQPLPPTWETHITAQPCYLFTPSAGAPGEILDEDKGAVVGGHRLLVPLGTDVTEGDRINGVTDRRGQTVNANLFNVRLVIRKPDHRLLLLETIT